MDQNAVSGLQVEAVKRCQNPKPISAEEGRTLLGLFPIYGLSRSPFEVDILIARVSLDQSVRLQESIDALEIKSSRLSRQIIVLNWILAGLTLALLFFAYVTYANERHRDVLSADVAARQARDKQVTDCAEQARRTAEDIGKHPSGFGPPPTVTGESNHYNTKLGKCIVAVQMADKDSFSESVLDAYEQSGIMLCVTTFTPKGASKLQRTCLDSKNRSIDPADADKQIDALLRE